MGRLWPLPEPHVRVQATLTIARLSTGDDRKSCHYRLRASGASPSGGPITRRGYTGRRSRCHRGLKVRRRSFSGYLYGAAMRLNWLQRLALAVLGLGAMGAGVVASIMEWASAGVVSLILPGFILTIFSIVGVFANVHLKEGNLEWPKPEEPKPIKPADDPLRGEVEKLRTEQERVSRHVDDYILANGPAPDDDLTDEERLPSLYKAYQELEEEMDRRSSNGEDHDDGLDAEHFRKLRDKAYDVLVKEERRQWAQFEFGLRATRPKSIYDN